MSKFLEVTVITTHDGAELVADILGEYTELGVSVKDYADVKALESMGSYWDYADESVLDPTEIVLVQSSYEIESANDTLLDIKDRLKTLKEFSPFNLGSLEISTKEIEGDLWKEKWKENFKPIRIDKIVITPEWIDYVAKDSEKVVRLNSNMAFGTGEHETTSMCVEYLCKYVNAGTTVIDFGCGSGILGISALKLGAKKVLMTDIDECAVKATKDNLELNGLNGEVLLKNLLDDNTIKGDVIVCNIMAEVLINFAPNLKNNLFNGGIVILSGILSDRLDKVENAYIAQGFKVLEHKTKGEWSACVLKKD